MSEMNLDRVDANHPTPTTSSASAGQPSGSDEYAMHLKRRYTRWFVFAPTVIFMAVFGALCARECTALPWLAFIYAPIPAVVIMAVVATVMWIRSGNLPNDQRASVRRHILTSIFWGPFAAYLGFAALAAVLGFFGFISAIFW
jgi:hypothetical protein